MEHTCVVILKCYSMNGGKDCQMSDISRGRCSYQRKSFDKKYNICDNKDVIRESLWEETQQYI